MFLLILHQISQREMKLFDVQENHNPALGMLLLTKQSAQLLIDICKSLNLTLECLHLSLWVFHCQTRIITFCYFDRFVYICGAVLVATKLAECLKRPIDIIKALRDKLRKKKGVDYEDSEEKLQKIQKKVFEAEVNLMINIGFDFDVGVGLNYIPLVRESVKDEHTVEKVKQALTSLYKTDVVIYFQPEWILIAALQIVLKAQGKSIELSGFRPQLIEKLLDPRINTVKNIYLSREPQTD